MVSKHTILLFLIFIVYANHAMENKKSWTFSYILTNFLQRCQAERALWRQGYISHTQPRSSIIKPKDSIAPSSQTILTEQDMQTYLLTPRI